MGGLGAVPRLLEIFARLDPRPPAQTRFRGRQPSGNLRRRARARRPGAGRHPPQCARPAELRTRDSQPHAAPQRHRHADAPICRRRSREPTPACSTRARPCPGLRALEKYAVQCGGGTNHRIDLASGILIKNNHISLGGGLPAVLTRALEKRRKRPARAGRSAHSAGA